MTQIAIGKYLKSQKINDRQYVILVDIYGNELQRASGSSTLEAINNFHDLTLRQSIMEVAS